MNVNKLTILLLPSLFNAPVLYASTDQTGSSDHPLLGRYPDSFIKEHYTTDYGEATLIASPFKENEKNKIANLIKKQGKVTNIKYLINNTRASLLQLYTNYENALKKLNADILFSCKGETCLKGVKNPVYITLWANEQNSVLHGILAEFMNNAGIITASVTKANGQKVYLMVTVAVDNINKQRAIQFSIIEPNQMDTDLVAIGSTDEMETAIDKHGKIVLNGIYFAHNSTELTQKSFSTIKIITEFLKKNRSKSYYVVGHTDNQGKDAYNNKLSQGRADKVKDTLTQKYKIAAKQLHAIGIGSVSPAASNRNKNGKAANRRVELVER